MGSSLQLIRSGSRPSSDGCRTASRGDSLTIGQACMYLGLGEAEVRRLVAMGVLRERRRPGVLLLDRSQVRSLARQLRAGRDPVAERDVVTAVAQ